MPTPGIAYLNQVFKADLGVVISASHNPYHDNGIKFFDGKGAKLTDEVELEIERHLDDPAITLPSHKLGKAKRIDTRPGPLPGVLCLDVSRRPQSRRR